MHESELLTQAFVFLLSAVVAVPVAKKLGLGSVLGYLCAGAVIGPFALGLIGHDVEGVMAFAEFGVVMMLFLVGLELDPSRLWRMRIPILGLGGLQVVVTSLALMLAGLGMGYPWQHSLAVGMILAMSSTAIVLQTLNEKSLLKTEAGQASFSVLLFQDIAVIPLLAILPLLALDNAAVAEASHTGLSGWKKTLLVLVVVAGLVLVGRWVSRHLFRIIAETRMRETFTATALLLVVGIALLMELVGLSPALGTFVAGVVMANSEYRHELESEIEPFKGLLLALFFISVGASIDFALFAAQPLTILALVAALIAVKMLVLFALGRGFGMRGQSNAIFIFALAQGGEFAFVLFTFASNNGILPDDIIEPLVLVVALSMAFTPLLILANERWILPRLSGNAEQLPEHDHITSEEARAIVVGFGRFGQIVGRMLRMNGFNITVLEHDAAQVDTVRRFGHQVFFGDAVRLDLLEAAGIDQAELLVIAIDDHNRCRSIVELVRRHYPAIRIISRARGRREAAELLSAGADHVERETFNSALALGRTALQLLGFRSYQAHRAAELFRHHDEVNVRELREVLDDETAFFNRTRQHADDLTRVMQADAQVDLEETEQSWDRD
ncbi:monovalent cation:proton antiporter-2 (CPA2) family protein [Thalassolituus sp. LLYu03]|uniref:monovalent cation:proton antiporter-2 (CPA2) family protein n=1 Tax=Thalassolituus sp. LLYu03 TaxID=3421656 RepID=UPI003D293AC4